MEPGGTAVRPPVLHTDKHYVLRSPVSNSSTSQQQTPKSAIAGDAALQLHFLSSSSRSVDGAVDETRKNSKILVGMNHHFKGDG